MLRNEIAEWTFLACLAVVVYAYAGYWLVLRLFARRRPVAARTMEPTVTVVMAARNEGGRLREKLRNLMELEYPAERVQIVVVSDGSTDDTAPVLAEFERVVAVVLPTSGGKALALNEGVRRATGELLLMVDVRQRLDLDVLRQLVPLFADGSVGAASGELLLEQEDGSPSREGLGVYWKIEKAVRRMESATGSVVGVTGAIYMMRRELYRPLPAGLLLDDVLVPMQVARAGYRVLFEPGAVARDRVFAEPGKEFGRKVRTLTGNLQIVSAAPWLLGASNPLLWRFWSHKLLRLAVPVLLLGMLLSSAVATAAWMRWALVGQLLFFGLALLGLIVPTSRRWRAVGIPATFVMLNVAAAVAFYTFWARRDVWR